MTIFKEDGGGGGELFSSMLIMHLQGTGTTSDFPSQIEVTLLTARSPSQLHTLMESITDHLDLVHLRKISAMSLTSPDKPGAIYGSRQDGCEDQVMSEDAVHMTKPISDLGSISDLGECPAPALMS